jgi:hypothetical protein
LRRSLLKKRAYQTQLRTSNNDEEKVQNYTEANGISRRSLAATISPNTAKPTILIVALLFRDIIANDLISLIADYVPNHAEVGAGLMLAFRSKLEQEECGRSHV